MIHHHYRSNMGVQTQLRNHSLHQMMSELLVAFVFAELVACFPFDGGQLAPHSGSTSGRLSHRRHGHLVGQDIPVDS